MEDIIKTLRESKVELTKEDLRQVNNILVAIQVSTNKIVEEKEIINKNIQEIKNILNIY